MEFITHGPTGKMFTIDHFWVGENTEKGWMRGKSPHEADSRTTVITVLVSGADGQVRAEEECQRMRQPCALALFTFIHFSNCSRR